jgi:cbb3-type cytochrome oxidase subunit 3
MKKFDFVIILKRPDYKRIDAISLLMCFFAVIIFIYRAIQNSTPSVFNYLISVFIIGCCVYNLIQTKKIGLVPRYNIALSAACYGFIMCIRDAHVDWLLIFLIILYLVASVLEKRAKTDLRIEVNEKEISFTSLPPKKYLWNELNNVLIKDGIITVDCKNNKLIQKDIREEVSAETEKEFNEFCKKQFSQLKNDRITEFANP